MQKGLIFLKTQHQLVVQLNEQSVYQISGESRAGACPPLFLDQTEGQRAEKKFFKTAPPPSPYLGVWMTGPLRYLKVWMNTLT